jgi:hypothetical protein
MKTHSWMRNLFARPPGQCTIRKRPPRVRPALEVLEHRTVPSTFTVTNLLDDGSVGSLRWAVGQANATGGDETIDFDPTVFATPQTITLSGTQLELTDTTGAETITGPAVRVTVDGGGLSRVFQTDGMVTASISGLTITGGNNFSRNQGGGIFNSGTLTLTNCTVRGNSAYNGFYPFEGGGIFNSGMLTLTNCTVSGNDAIYGGGIYNGGTATLTNCTVSGNDAGSVGSGGGGGGGIFNGGTLTLTNCTVSGNCEINGGGGGLLNGGTATLTNCTVSGNDGPSGGGLFGGAFLHNTLIAGNVRGPTGMTRDDVNGRLDPASDYNLIGDGTGMTGIRNGVNGNLVGSAAAPIDPRLDALGDHGGPTLTRALLPGSPALNAGDPNQLGRPDQRGVVRSGGVNIGAYQASATAFLVSAPAAVQPGVPFDVTVTAVDPYIQVAVGYTGTVTFGTTDTDPGVVLPAEYAFVPDDGGRHRFTDTGRGEVTLVTPGDQMLTIMDTADNTITGRIVITVSAVPAPPGQGPPPRTVPARPAQVEAPAPGRPSASEVVGREPRFASLHGGDYVWPTVARLRHPWICFRFCSPCSTNCGHFSGY